MLCPRTGHTMNILSPFISSTRSPVHVLMLSIHAALMIDAYETTNELSSIVDHCFS